VESEMRDGKLIIHNYGAGGVGFQASWYVHAVFWILSAILIYFLQGVWRNMPPIYFPKEHGCRQKGQIMMIDILVFDAEATDGMI
jgi:hypothetical protein